MGSDLWVGGWDLLFYGEHGSGDGGSSFQSAAAEVSWGLLPFLSLVLDGKGMMGYNAGGFEGIGACGRSMVLWEYVEHAAAEDKYSGSVGRSRNSRLILCNVAGGEDGEKGSILEIGRDSRKRAWGRRRRRRKNTENKPKHKIKIKTLKKNHVAVELEEAEREGVSEKGDTCC